MNRDLLTTSERRRLQSFTDAFARRHGYADAECMGTKDPREVLREEVEKPTALLDLAWSNDWLCDERIGRALHAAVIERDDLHACDLLREVLQPLIDAEVDKRATAEGVDDLMEAAA